MPAQDWRSSWQSYGDSCSTVTGRISRVCLCKRRCRNRQKGQTGSTTSPYEGRKWLASEGQVRKKNRSRYCGEEGSGRFLRTGFSPEAGAGRVAAGVADGLGESASVPPDPSM